MRKELDLSYLTPAAGKAASAAPSLLSSPASAQRLDLYLPDPMPRVAPPIFVYIHGGAWISGDKAQYGALGRALAGQGIAVAIINYRLSGDGTLRHPSHVQDAAAAVAFVRASAARFGYDPARVFVGGHSAGGFMSAHLSLDPRLLAAVGEKPEALRGFIGIEGIYDLPALGTRFPSYRQDFLESAFGPDAASWRGASPQSLLVPGKAVARRPWLLIHSPADELVEIEQTTRFAGALKAAGVPVQLVTEIGGSHFDVVTQLLLPVGAVAQGLLAFLRS